MTIDTRDVNELGPGKFRTSAENGEACYFKTNKSDTHFTSFFARRSQADPRRFSFVKPNSDFELVNKSLDFRLNNSVLNGELKRKHQSVNSEYFSNGRSKSDSFTQRRDLFSQSTDVRRQSDRGNSRDQSASTKKAKISLKIKLLIGIRSDILLQESSILPQELNLEIFYQTFLTQGLAKVIFIMKISS